MTENKTSDGNGNVNFEANEESCAIIRKECTQHARREPANQAGSFYFPMKDPLTLDAQLQHLVEERGLDLGELAEDEAIGHLASLNYYRLRGYWLTLEKNEKFIEGTKFQDMVQKP